VKAINAFIKKFLKPYCLGGNCMNKKIILYSFAIFAIHNVIYSAVFVPTMTGATTAMKNAGMASKLPGMVPAGAGSGSAVAGSMPKIHLDDTQMKAFTDSLARSGARNYLPQIQMIWETNPELFYNAQQAFQSTDSDLKRKALETIIKEAKTVAQQQSTSFNVQDAVMQNKNLETMINQKLPNNFASIRQKMGKMSTDLSFGNETTSNKNTFHALNRVIPELESSIHSVFTDPKLTPQDAASKLNTLISDVSDAIGQSEMIGFKNPNLKTGMSATTETLNNIKDILTNAQNALQKAVPGQQQSANYQQLETWVKNINKQEGKVSGFESSSVPQSFESGEALQTIPMPAEIAPFFEQQTSLLNQDISNVSKDLYVLTKQIFKVDEEKKQVLTQAKSEIVRKINIIHDIQKQLTSLGSHPDALTEINLKTSYMLSVIAEITTSLEALRSEIKDLSNSDLRKNMLETLEKIVNGVQTINLDAQTTALVLNEFYAQKDIIAQLKKDIDLANFVSKTQTDLTTIESTTKNLKRILSSGDILTTDKAPMSMVEVLEKNLAAYLTTLQEITTIKDLAELSSLETKLKEQAVIVTQSVDSIFSKISWLPTSTRKNEALDTVRKLKNQFMRNMAAVNDFFKKANEIEEKHMFVIVKKDSIEMGYMLIKNKCEALKLSITQEIGKSPITAAKQATIDKLNDLLQKINSDIQKIETAQTSSELNEFEIALPRYQETLNETLKLFGLKLVVGLTAAGTVTWLAEKGTQEEPSTNKDILVNIQTPTTEAEFRQESEKVLQMIQNLKNIPFDKLKAAIAHINVSIKALDLNKFKESAQIFFKELIENIKALYNSASTSLNNTRAKIYKTWLESQEKSHQLFLKLNKPKSTSSTTVPSSDPYEEFKKFVNKWINKK